MPTTLRSNDKHAQTRTPEGETVSRQRLIELLNEDLAREYKAIIAYVVYSQVLKGAQYMKIAEELEVHAGEELQHALIIAKQIDYVGGMPVVMPRQVKTSEDPLKIRCEDVSLSSAGPPRRIIQGRFTWQS